MCVTEYVSVGACASARQEGVLLNEYVCGHVQTCINMSVIEMCFFSLSACIC